MSTLTLLALRQVKPLFGDGLVLYCILNDTYLSIKLSIEKIFKKGT